jgi:AcrR family transcriptional regulator
VLIAAARRCFVDQGYEATSIEAVLARTGVSKGALYHHFSGKAELLAAVFETVSRETVMTAQGAASVTDSPRAALSLSLKGWMRAVLAPEPSRIILEAGPAVLGYAAARLIEEGIIQAPMRRMIERTVQAGEARCGDIDLVARLLSAAVSELALTARERRLEGPALERFDAHTDALIDALLPAAA